MWIVYYTGTYRVKATFLIEEFAREFHKQFGGDLVKVSK